MKLTTKLIEEAEKALEKVFKEHFNDKEIEFDTNDAATIGLYVDMIQKVKSFKILIEAEASAGTDAIARTIMENHVYLKLLLKNPEFNIRYGKSFLVANRVKQLKMYEKFIEKSRSGEKIRNLLGMSREEFIEGTGISDVKEKIEILEQDYAEVFRYREHKDNWYNLDKRTKSFEQLCNRKDIDMDVDYEVIYRYFSSEIHATNAGERIYAKEKEELEIKILPENYELQKAIVRSYLYDTITKVYEYYELNGLRQYQSNIAIHHKFN
ncbi:hypothetical protein ATL39_0920 [Sinobaca qinghaiensis]|uniref:Uncharacterized protein n=1 Tax=Sinobaca qinghaiensis TaxID=342944 RepID=A0A419V5F6_9BACL|nr:DUF5677 domain-containing protein [Sinobaca qinghaiensis]RKD75222.1 hypothetical protein ATL39_0920 [Sinobaca qinghaiensis]